MRRNNRLIVLAIWLGAAMMALTACGSERDGAEDTATSVRVQEIVNQVEVNTLDTETNEPVFVDLQLGQYLQTGNLVKTHKNSSARIDISIKNFNRVSRTAPRTIWQLGRFALNGDAIIELQEGKIFVFDDDDGQEHWPLHIETPAGTASARGTWMAVEFDPESATIQVDCLRGICELENDFGYQVFTNAQTVVATAVTVPTEPVPMEQLRIDEFHRLPEVLTDELHIPVLFTPVEVQAKLEKTRTAAFERMALEEKREVDSDRVSEIINTARALEEDGSAAINPPRETTDGIEQQATDQGTLELDTALDVISGSTEEVTNDEPDVVPEVAGEVDDEAKAEATPTEGPAIADSEAGALTPDSTLIATGNTAPVALNDTATTVRAAAISISLLSNDSDADNDLLSITNLTQPSRGKTTVNGDNTVDYRPDAGFIGEDTFTFTANDGADDSNIARVTITVAEPGKAVPVAVDDTGSGLENSANINIDVLQNDSDADRTTLAVANLTQPSNGSVTLVVGNNTVDYAPDSGFFGVDTFTYTANDGKHDSNIATVTVTVHAAPVAVGDTASTLGGIGVTIDVLQNDTDAESDVLSVTILTQPSSGIAVVNEDNTVSYTPGPGFSGEDSFTYQAHDGRYDSKIATVTVKVRSIPTANDDVASTLKGYGVTIDVLQNDTDADGDTLSVTNLSQPTNGTASLNGDHNVHYLPDSDFTGEDSFTYQAYDGKHNSNIATVTVTVNAAPLANDDAVSTIEGVGVIIDVLSNDTDADSETLSVTELTQPSSGTANVKEDNQVHYTPGSGFTGEDTFTYRANDGKHNSNIAIVTVTVLAAATVVPVALDDTASTSSGVEVIIDVLQNDTRANSGSLSVTNLTQPSNGTVELNGDGTVIYTPGSAFTGEDSFTYRATDGKLDSNIATVTVEVLAAKNLLPVAVDDTAFGAVIGANLNIDLLGNDWNPNGGTLSVANLTQPANGTATLKSDNTVDYTPNQGFIGVDSFTYQANDGTNNSNVATVTVTFAEPANTVPVAVDDTASTFKDVGVTIDVLQNDTDADGDSMTVTNLTGQLNGSVVLKSDYTVEYTPDLGFTGVDSFTYRVNDGTDDSNIATVTVTVS